MISQLEAVNSMLTSIGSAPVNTITGQVSADVATAKSILEEVRKDVLLQGWAFNRETRVSLSPGGDGRIATPLGTLRIDNAFGATSSVDLVQRGNYLFDRAANSYTFTAAISVDRTVDLGWDLLPEVARAHIAARASAEFVARMDAGQERYQYASQRALATLVSLRQEETDVGDYTIFDNETAQNILRRGI